MSFAKILRYEIKKIFGQKSIYFIAALLMAISIFNIYKTSNAMGFFSQDRESNYVSQALIGEKYSMELTDENIAKFMSDLEAAQAETGANPNEKPDYDKYYTGYSMGDSSYMEEIKNELERIYFYNDYVVSIRNKASNLAEQFENVNDYLYRHNKKISEIYSDRKITSYAHTENIPIYLDYKFSSLSVMILILLGLTTKFCGEREIGMDQTLKTCKFGSDKTNVAKLLSGYFYVLVVSVVFAAMDLFVFQRCYLFSGFSQYLYALEAYEGTTLNIKIWQTILLLFLLKFLGFMVFAGIIMLISGLSRSSVATYAISAAVTVALILVSVITPQGAGEYLNLFNPIRLINAQSMFKSYQTINFFSYPVFKAYAAVALGSLLFIFCSVFTLFAARKYRTVKQRRVKEND